MGGQESSMSLASGICLALPVAGTCSLLLSLNNNAQSRRPRPLGQPSAPKPLTLTRQTSGDQGTSTPPSSPHSRLACTSLHLIHLPSLGLWQIMRATPRTMATLAPRLASLQFERQTRFHQNLWRVSAGTVSVFTILSID
jgi:hypothetical protein